MGTASPAYGAAGSDDGLAGQVVLVSGAAAGIGRAVAEGFAARGSRLAVVDINGPALDELAGELAAAGVAVERFVADATDGRAVESVVRGTVGAYGRLDVLVNVVGGSRPGKDIVELGEDEWADLLRFNLTSAYLMCHHAVPDLAATGGGAIVNVSSGRDCAGCAGIPATARRRPVSSA